MWFELFYKSVEIVERVIDVLKPKIILVTSAEVYRYYSLYKPDGKLMHNDNVVWLDHPGSPWWNRVKKGGSIPSRIKLEKALERTYGL